MWKGGVRLAQFVHLELFSLRIVTVLFSIGDMWQYSVCIAGFIGVIFTWERSRSIKYDATRYGEWDEASSRV